MGVGVSPSPLFFLIMDTKLTNRIIAWLESSHDDDSNIIEGATLMLQCNRNRILYNNVLRKPANFVGKIDYELRKHLRYRKDSLTIDNVIEMDKNLIPAVNTELNNGQPVDDDNIIDSVTDDDSNVKKGKREDHDNLPVEIQALWTENADRYKKMKKLFETLKTMQDKEPCDRYEFLKPLKELYDDYHRDMEIYDGYKDGDALPVEESKDGDNAALTAAKTLGACRKFISVNLNLLESPAGIDADKRKEILAALKDKFQILESMGAKIKPATLSRFDAQNLLAEEVTPTADEKTKSE